MASPAEAWPDRSEQDYGAQYVGHEEQQVIFKGEIKSFPDPGNFPGLLDAYLHNRDGEKSDRLEIQANQTYLITSPLGHIISDTLDRFCEDESSRILFEQAFSQTEEKAKAYCYSLILAAIKEHLPPEIDAEVLWDPWAYEEAA